MDELRDGTFDVLIGVNLLREGLDLPEVSLVAILDADKEGFLRNTRSLTQTAGRAARNVHGRVIMYADRITQSMQETIDETARRRMKQMEYNRLHNITPTQIAKPRKSLLDNEELRQTQSSFGAAPVQTPRPYQAAETPIGNVAQPAVDYNSVSQLEAEIERAKARMLEAAKKLEFMEAAQLRDYMVSLTERLEKLTTKK
jgi:excinuclease ABC subunit B